MDPSSSNATCSQYDQRHNQPGTSRKKLSHKHHQYRMKPIHDIRNKRHKEQQEEQPSSFQPITTTTTPTDPDLSADTHRYFAEARSTPIMYSASSLHSTTSTSSSSSLEYNTKKNHTKRHQQAADDNRSLCSAHSFTAAQQQQMEYLNNRTGSSMTTTTHSSTRNQTFYFSTPLPPQKQQPYQYHDPTWYYGDESNTPPWHTPATLSQSQQPSAASGSKSSFLARRKDMFLQSNANHRRRLSEGGASIKSAFSTGRQTIKSWRQKRINLMMKQHQLPDFETKAFCQVCEKYIQTRIRYRNGSMVWLMSFILLLCTVVLFWVPFYVKYFKDVAHFCPGCGKQLGVSYRL